MRAKRSDGWHCSKGRREGVIWCKLLRFGSSFWHPIFIDSPSDQMTSNVDANRKATVRHVLWGVSLGPLVILRPALLLCPRWRAVLQYNRQAAEAHPGAVRGLSWTRCGGVRAVCGGRTFHNFCSERALREPQIAIQSRPIQVCTLRRGSPYPDLP